MVTITRRFLFGVACATYGYIHGKVFTLLTMLIANNLNPYKTPYKFFEVFTSFIINNLSVYINDNETVLVVTRRDCSGGKRPF